jgi:hypothetical protein
MSEASYQSDRNQFVLQGVERVRNACNLEVGVHISSPSRTLTDISIHARSKGPSNTHVGIGYSLSESKSHHILRPD